MASSLPPGARCAVHPERSAERTCVRCGNYMCNECGAAGDHCAACVSRMGPGGGAFPYSSDRYSLDGLLNLAWTRWKEHWTLLLVAFGSAIVLIYGLSFAGEGVFMVLGSSQGGDSAWLSPLHPVRLAFAGVMSVVQFGVQLVLLGLCLDVLRGHKPQPREALARLRKLPAAFVQAIVMYGAIGLDLLLHFGLFAALGGLAKQGWTPLWITIGTWVALIPLRVYVFLGTFFAQPALLVDPELGPFGGFARSWRVTSGHRFEVLGIGFVCALIAFGGVLACCIGAFVSLPVATLLYCSLFLALSNVQRGPAELS